MMGTVVILAEHHQILPGIQRFQIIQKRVPFCETAVPSAVNAKGNQAAGFSRVSPCSMAVSVVSGRVARLWSPPGR